MTKTPDDFPFPEGEAAMTQAFIGYARVSTGDQTPQLQLDDLEKAGCTRIFHEKLSGKNTDRPELKAALDYLRSGDTLVVWKLDRLGRSVKDVLVIADDLHSRGVGLRILTGKLAGQYSPTGEGKFFFTMMAAFAELERDILVERTKAGMQAAKLQGNLPGRPHVLDDEMAAVAQDLYAQGVPVPDIARQLTIKKGPRAGKSPSRASVYRYLRP
jgi:DNA invertase Pin-like site-specific DNA recombinase